MWYKLKNPTVKQVEVDGRCYLDVSVETQDCKGLPVIVGMRRISLQEAHFESKMVPSSPYDRKEAYVTLKIEDDDEGALYWIRELPVEITLAQLCGLAEEHYGRHVRITDLP